MKNGVYIVGGDIDPYYDVDRFDRATRTFSTVSSLRLFRQNIGICQYDSDSFIISGGNDLGWAHETNHDTLTQVGNLTKARNEHVMVKSEDGDIFAIGGYDCLNTVENFDRKTQTWSVIGGKSKKPSSSSGV